MLLITGNHHRQKRTNTSRWYKKFKRENNQSDPKIKGQTNYQMITFSSINTSEGMGDKFCE
jgi:hypothetical protein